MTPEQIDHVFGRGRLKMDTGAHVEVFREAAPPGESRRYTKRFLTTADGDYAQWTEREWRILALLIGHGSRCVPDIVQYDRDARGTKLVQTYDAGATVDQWATLLPVERGGSLYARVFEDCAHWWALAHHCLVALDEIHSLQLVHLDIKGDNICIPIGPAGFDPAAPDERLFPMFGKLRLIDFAFSLVSGESLPTPLPIGWQPDYDYQSPRLLHALEAGRAGDLRPTENLDWRCDMYSLAAMLKRYLPGERRLCPPELACGWTAQRYDAAKALILKIRAAHDRELTLRRPHAELIVETSAHVRENELAQSLEYGWTLARDAQPFAVPATPLTPVTRLALPLRLVIPPRDDIVAVLDAVRAEDDAPLRSAKRRNRVPLIAAAAGVAAIGILPFVADSGAFVGDAARFVMDAGRTVRAAMTHALDPEGPAVATMSSQPGADGKPPASPARLPVPDAAVTPEAVAATAGPAPEAEAATRIAAVAHDASVAATESSEAAIAGRAAIAIRVGGATRFIACIAGACILSGRAGGIGLDAPGNLAGAADFTVARNEWFAEQAKRRQPFQTGVTVATLGQNAIAADKDGGACVATSTCEGSASHATRRRQQDAACDDRDACRRDTSPPTERRGETRNRNLHRVASAGERRADGGRVRRIRRRRTRFPRQSDHRTHRYPPVLRRSAQAWRSRTSPPRLRCRKRSRSLRPPPMQCPRRLSPLRRRRKLRPSSRRRALRLR